MPTQFLAGRCSHCHNGLLRMLRATLKIELARVTASYECLNPLCNNIMRIILYDINREEWLNDWQKEISDQYCPPPKKISYYPL